MGDFQFRVSLAQINKVEVEEKVEIPFDDEFKDSGRESQLSQSSTVASDANETLDKADLAAANEVLENMTTLDDEDLPKEGTRNHSSKQLELLLSFYEVSKHPTPEQKDILASKVRIDSKKVHYWFSNERRKKRNGNEMVDSPTPMDVDDNR